MSRVVVAMVVAALCALAALASGARAQDSAVLAGKLDELDSLYAREGDLRASIDSQNSQVNALIGRLSGLRARQSEIQAKLSQKQAELDRATAALRKEQKHLREVRARLRRAVDLLSDYLIEIYKTGAPDLLTVVLEAGSFRDILAEAEYLDSIAGYEDSVIGRVRELREDVVAEVGGLADERNEIESVRREIEAHRDQVASARAPIEAQHAQLVAARAERQQTLNALLAREKELVGEISPSADPPGAGATLVNGRAIAPPDAPLQVKAAIDAANRISAKPYIWGGGHGSFESSGYDCSGAVSYALHGGGLLSSPLDSTGLMSWGAPGPGSWITVYANSGHVYAVIAGLRWDTSGDAVGSGPRWHPDMASPAGFVARHAPGL